MSVQLLLDRLRALAKLCNFQLDHTIVALYEKGLEPYGFEESCRAVEFIVINRRTRDPFPSVKEIVGVMRPETNDDSEAIEAAARIIQAVSRFGYPNALAAQEFVGELGWRVVERFGGWATLCQTMTSDNLGILHAQFRQLAKSQIQRAKAGLDSIAPTIPTATLNLLERAINWKPKRVDMKNFDDYLPEPPNAS